MRPYHPDYLDPKLCRIIAILAAFGLILPMLGVQVVFGVVPETT